MSRSKYKSAFMQYDLLTNLKENRKKEKEILKTKNLLILPEYVDKFIKVYNGKKKINLKILKGMVGYKFGEFIYTKQKFIYKKK